MRFGVKPSAQQIKTETRASVAENVVAESIIAPKPIAKVNRVSGNAKLTRLIGDDFPFDDSQLEAISGMAGVDYGCLTGAAGTGKTTVTKAIVDRLIHTVDEVDIHSYFDKGDEEKESDRGQKWVPSIALCGFTGRSTQMIKKNFPSDWHDNIMTIHRLLGFVPEYYEDWNEDESGYVTKRRFVPSYTAENKLPWDIIIIDESGMLGLDLWNQLYDAMVKGTRVYMIGDINQLPPVHGKSIFGYAMAKWPAWELTTIHRQEGVDNPIVDNAWRILNGEQPVSGGKFQMIELKGDTPLASRKVRAILDVLKTKNIYDPIRDSVITTINGHEGSKGRELGQIPLNQQLALQFNPQESNVRYIIDGGRERKQFAVGDKVMATKNDHEAGITNGMTGVITSIVENGGYRGDPDRFGTVEAVNAAMRGELDGVDDDIFTLDDLSDDMESYEEKKDGKEKKERGPSSHIVTVQFGEGEYARELSFATLSEVGSLEMAYVVTCHKMQGGESPVVIIIAHHAHRAMLYREWLYTAVTRASEKCILLYTPLAIRSGLTKQKIKGKSLKEKIESFNTGGDTKRLIPMTRKVNLPGEQKSQERIDVESKSRASNPNSNIKPNKPMPAGLASLVAKTKRKVSARNSTTRIGSTTAKFAVSKTPNEEREHEATPQPHTESKPVNAWAKRLGK